MKRILLITALILSMILPSAGCGKKELVKIRLNEVTHSVFYAPQYVALNRGFFAEEGLEIELTNGQGADKVMTAVLSVKYNQT
jgi:NitT/TauT family transport system substrate-binding protein